MGYGGMMALALSRDMYREGARTTLSEGIRRFKDRPAMAAGEAVEIVRFTTEDQYVDPGFKVRLLVRRLSDGAERWVDAYKVEPVESDGALDEAMGKIAAAGNAKLAADSGW